MNTLIDDLIKILHEGKHSLVISNGEVRAFDGRGVSDLFRLVTDEPGFLRGACLADKVVGKGAAALMVLGGVNAVHADVISAPALALLKDSPVKVAFTKSVENVINRRGDGICPIETLCLPCATAAECYPLIEQFINSKNK